MQPKDVDVTELVTELCTENMPKVKVRKSIGMTFNTGNYTALRGDVAIEIEGTLDNYEKIVNLVNQKLESELEQQLSDMQLIDSSMLTRK